MEDLQNYGGAIARIALHYIRPCVHVPLNPRTYRSTNSSFKEAVHCETREQVGAICVQVWRVSRTSRSQCGTHARTPSRAAPIATGLR